MSNQATELMDFFKTIPLDAQVDAMRVYSSYEKATPAARAKVEKLLKDEMSKEEIEELKK